MFDTLVLALTIAIFLFVAYLLLKAYRPAWFQSAPSVEPFAPKPMGPPTATVINTPPLPTPAVAPPVQQEPPQEERVVSPGGPGAPNMQAPIGTPGTISPEAKPVDPYEDRNMEAPIHDSMRHPELSFGPGVKNTGVGNIASSGVGDPKSVLSESQFSPEFAQNGGIFMGTVTANDLSKGDTYANA